MRGVAAPDDVPAVAARRCQQRSIRSHRNRVAHGLEQCKRYATNLNVPFVFATNGHRYVEYDVRLGVTTGPKVMRFGNNNLPVSNRQHFFRETASCKLAGRAEDSE